MVNHMQKRRERVMLYANNFSKNVTVNKRTEKKNITNDQFFGKLCEYKKAKHKVKLIASVMSELNLHFISFIVFNAHQT